MYEKIEAPTVDQGDLRARFFHCSTFTPLINSHNRNSSSPKPVNKMIFKLSTNIAHCPFSFHRFQNRDDLALAVFALPHSGLSASHSPGNLSFQWIEFRGGLHFYGFRTRSLDQEPANN